MSPLLVTMHSFCVRACMRACLYASHYGTCVCLCGCVWQECVSFTKWNGISGVPHTGDCRRRWLMLSVSPLCDALCLARPTVDSEYEGEGGGPVATGNLAPTRGVTPHVPSPQAPPTPQPSSSSGTKAQQKRFVLQCGWADDHPSGWVVVHSCHGVCFVDAALLLQLQPPQWHSHWTRMSLAGVQLGR